MGFGRRKLRDVVWPALLTTWLLLVSVWIGSAFWSLSWSRQGLRLCLHQGELLVTQSSPVFWQGGWELQQSQSPRISFAWPDWRDIHSVKRGLWWGPIDFKEETVVVPFWLLLLPLTLIVVLVYRRSRRPSQGCCQRCGYNLTGNTSGVCPECGAPVNSGCAGQPGATKGS